MTVRNREGTQNPPARWEHLVLIFAGIIAVWGRSVDIRLAIFSKVDQKILCSYYVYSGSIDPDATLV